MKIWEKSVEKSKQKHQQQQQQQQQPLKLNYIVWIYTIVTVT